MRFQPKGTRQGWAVLLLLGSLTATHAWADTPDEQFQQAGELYRARLYTTAAQELKRFLDANPNHPQARVAAYQWAAAIYRSDRGANGVDYAAAAAAYEWALQKYPNAAPAMISAARFELGEAYYFLKKPDKTVSVLTQYLKTAGADSAGKAAWANYYLGKTYEDLKQPQLAKAAFEKVRDAYPASEPAADALLEIGLINLDAGQTAAAMQAFTLVRTKYADAEAAPEARIRLGEAQLSAKNYAAARQSFRDALADPKAAAFKTDALQGLADTDFADKKWADAATGYGQLLKVLAAGSPDRATMQLRQAHSYFNGGNWAPALAIYQPLEQVPNAAIAAQARYFAAGALAEQQKYAEAAAKYQQFLDSYPKHALAPKAALRMGEAYENAKDPGKAAQAYKIVLASYAKSDAAKDAQQALTDLAGNASDNATVESALRSLPASAAGNARLRLAQSAFQKGEWTKAGQLASTVAEAKPDAATTENAYYLVGSARLNGKDPVGAAGAFRKQLTAFPKGPLAPQGRLGLAWALEDQKKWPEAEVAARAAVAANTGAAKERAQLTLAGVLFQGGKATEAAPIFAALEKSTDKSLAAQAAQGGALALEKRNLWKEAAARWAKYAALSTDANVKGQALLRQGLALGKAKDVTGALVAFDAAAIAAPKTDIAAEALYESAWLAHDNGQKQREAASFSRLETDFPDSKFAPEAVFRQGEAALAAKDWAAASGHYERLLTKWPQDDLASQAAYQLGTAQYGAGNWAAAGPAFDKSGDVRTHRDFAVVAPFWAAESYRKAGDKTKAAARYETFVQNVEAGNAVPNDAKELVPAARLGWGLSLDDPAKQAAIYRPALNAARGATRTELNFRLGEALAKQNKWAEALPPLLKVTTEALQSEWAEPAMWWAGQALENTGAKADALALYRQLAARQPASEWTAKADTKIKELAP